MKHIFLNNRQFYSLVKRTIPIGIRRLPNQIYYQFLKIFNYIVGVNLSDQQIVSKYLHNHSVVIGGPFKGIKYNSESYGSSLSPKIIGTYEDQLYKYLPIDNEYDYILDIGCAEGYYAIGLAYTNPETKVIAYDISEKARALCKNNAKANRISNLTIRREFELKDMRNITSKKVFVLCDIEGAEYQLFYNSRSTSGLSADWLIEVHEHRQPGTANIIINYFRKTHNVSIIYDKIKEFKDYPHLQNLSPKKFKICADEHRDTNNMIWLYLEKIK